MTTDPFDPRAQTEIAQTIGTTERLYATDRLGNFLAELPWSDDTTHTLKFDEAWTPHVQFQATIDVLEDMTILDPRKGVRVCLELGYVYPGGIVDQHLIADLALDDWETKDSRTASLTAYSDESLLGDWEAIGAAVTYAAGTSIVSVISSELARTIGVTPVVTSPSTETLTEPLVVGPGVNRWDVMASLADQADVWFYCDALRNWHIDRRPSTEGVPQLSLSTGTVGIVTNLEDGLNRRDWGNTAVIEYQDRKFGVSTQAGGTLGTTAVGVKAVRVRRDAPYPGDSASKSESGTLLRRILTRGRTQSVSAVAAYWLRPGQTVTDPDAVRRIVSRIQFVIPNSTMTLTTRTPEN